MERDLSSLTHIEYEGMTILTDNRTEIWMTQKQIAELLGISIQSVSDMLNVALTDGDVELDSVLSLRLKAEDGKEYPTKHYDLNAILIVGFRSKNTQKAIAFRKWVYEAVLVRFIRDLEAQVETLKTKTPPNEPKSMPDLQLLRDERDYFRKLANQMLELHAFEVGQHQRLVALFQMIPPAEQERLHKLLHALGTPPA